MHARIHRVVDECLLVCLDRAVRVAFRRARIAQPHVRVRVERPELDRFRVGFEGLVEQAAGLDQEEVAQRLVRFGL